jgi:transposase
VNTYKKVNWDDAHIVLMVRQGKSNQEISRVFDCSEATVHRRLALLRKLGKLPKAKRGPRVKEVTVDQTVPVSAHLD